MIYKVKSKQENSKMCFICGLKNEFGLYAAFYETDDKQLIALFKAREEHQGYPGRLHGGIAAAILDEAIGRAVNIGKENGLWGVTLEFNIKYKKPIPLNVELKAICRLTNENSRFFEGTGEIILPDGNIAATAKGKYLKMPISKIADFDLEENEWAVVNSAADPDKIDI
ncbi:MAG: PaaI family thioesterase [Actinobacteria bacterium]|nr:PaaI family thioesterase [Actinomycetota bacterium]